MPNAQKLLLRTSDLSEAVDAGSRIYCPHEIEIRGSGRGDITTLEVVRGGVQLRNIRLQAARAQLLAPTESTTVTSAALGNGFFHLPRFSAYYRAAFNETPGQTLRRSRPRRK